MTGAPWLLLRDESRSVERWRPGVVTRRLASAADGATALCVIEQEHEPGRGAPRHTHDVEEIVIVRAGTAAFDADGDRLVLGPGDAVVVRAGVPHGFVNAGDDLLRIEAVFAAAAPGVVYEEEAGGETAGQDLEIGRAAWPHRAPRAAPGAPD